MLSLSILFCSPNAAKLHFIRAKTKLILELTIIDIQIDFNCRKNKISVNSYIVPFFLCFGTIIKIQFLCTFLCPTERWPWELRENSPRPSKAKKCVLLRFAPPTGLVLRGPRKSVLFGVHIAAIPASKSPPFFVCYSELFGYPVYVLPLGVTRRTTAHRAIYSAAIYSPPPHLSCLCQWSGKYPFLISFT